MSISLIMNVRPYRPYYVFTLKFISSRLFVLFELSPQMLQELVVRQVTL